MSRPPVERWKPVPLEFFRDAFAISNWGRIRSIERVVPKVSRWGDTYYRLIGGNIIKPRTNNEDPHWNCIISRTIDGVSTITTVYPHKLCALAFKRPSNDPDATMVTFKNGKHTDIYPSNLQWISQSTIMKRRMKNATKERRNLIGNFQKQKTKAQAKEIALLFKLIDNGVEVKHAAERVGKTLSWAYYRMRRRKEVTAKILSKLKAED